MEIWKEIKDLPGYYVSNYGRVKANAITTKFGKQVKIYPERFLNIWYSRTGYNYIDISIKGKVKRFLLHRLVATHFIPNHENKKQINHIDGDKNNNHINNLEWCTSAENLKHARDLGLNNSIGCNNKMAKLKHSDIIEIRMSNKLLRELASTYNVAICTISDIKNFKTYKNV